MGQHRGFSRGNKSVFEDGGDSNDAGARSFGTNWGGYSECLRKFSIPPEICSSLGW
jgi:hypothetical protein